MSHMTLDDRIRIQEGLDLRLSIREIARSIGKSPSSVMREIEKHKVIKGKRVPDELDPCILKRNCNVYHLCKDVDCKSMCRTCSRCKTICPNYKPATCDLIVKSPYVCNGCKKYTMCPYTRILYLASHAQNVYRETLVASREGINIDPECLQRLDAIVSPLLLKGQSVSHILNTHADEIPCSRSTLYSYVDKSILTARNIDMPRKVRHRVRKSNHRQLAADTKLAVLTRNYTRFTDYMKEHPDTPVVEMDTVVGKLDTHKVLLTLLFRSCNLMLMILLEHKTQECVIEALNDLCDAIGIDVFKALFPVILTDRGTEFLFPEAIECDRNGEIRTKLFYCDPQASWQKGRLERNHEFIRMIIPKGTSLDHFTQEDMTLVMNHINSYARPQFGGATPYMLSKLILNPRLHAVMGLEEIAPDDVILDPTLLRR